MNTFNTTEGIEKNVRICYGCSSKNLQLLCVLAGGPLPEEERQTPQPINPTVSFNGSTIRVEAVRERPSIQSNQTFFNYLRICRAIVGLNVDSRVLAIESATQWRFLSEEEKQIYMMQTCFAGSIEIIQISRNWKDDSQTGIPWFEDVPQRSARERMNKNFDSNHFRFLIHYLSMKGSWICGKFTGAVTWGKGHLHLT